MGRSGGGCAIRVLFRAGIWLLLGCAQSLYADEAESAGDETAAQSFSSTSSQFQASLEAPAAPWSGDLWTRSRLSGGWAGARDQLAANGITFWGDITQYYQGVTTGGRAQRFAYGGRGDYLIDLDSQKLGLWEGGHLDLRGETRLGEDTNKIDGAISPPNFAMALPIDQNVTALTGVQYTQTLSERVTVFAGKLNLLDGTPASYEQGRRLNSFWNAAMQNNLSRVFLLPSTLGGGFTIRDEAEPVFNFYLLDTHFTPTTSGFDKLFTNGVVAYGEYRVRTNWFDRPGHSAAGFLYSNATRTSLDSNPFVVLPTMVPGPPLPVVTKSSAWTVTYRFDQVVYADPEDSSRTWTLNGDYGITDGNPNPIHWFANLSLVGSSPIRSRPNDTVGIGYYHLGVSRLKVLQALHFGDENGVELFYNAAVTPWFHLTPDLQILDPAQQQLGTALLVGLRARVSF
ncbi:MAG TPA: carbohydrate porin [Planctomycetaceae bacterium]|nr:carbohydrate porin [Planctomycetaceae bacterium]